MKELETDVVVISAGTAGLPAATTAAERGVRVIAFEKKGITGGTAYAGGQICGVGSNIQKRMGIDITPEQIFKLHMDYVHWRADARLVKAFYDESGKSIDWFEDSGVQCSLLPGPGEYLITHRAQDWIKIITEKAKALGVQFMLKTPVKKILRENGKIVGVIAQDSSGEEILARAKAVIVATGGFGNNPEVIKQYTGFEWGKDLFSFRIPGITGDGIRMAWEVGAAPTDMMMQLVFSVPHPYEGAIGVSFEFGAFAQVSNLMVNIHGERFINEEVIRDTAFGGNAIARQKGRCAFMIFDEDTKNYYEEEGLEAPMTSGRMGGKKGSGSQSSAISLEEMMKKMKETEAEIRKIGLGMIFADTLKTEASETFDVLLKKALDKGYQHFFVADSLEDLCQKTGIDLAGLNKTIEEYNAFCESKKDLVFGKKPEYLRPIRKPRFYAARFFPTAYGTLGGIKINYRTEVLNEEDEVIPGLYAAGTDAAAIYGDTYTRFLYGNTQGFCITSGRIAGKHAAEYVKSSK